MPIENYTIRERESFDRITADPHEIAGIYFFHALDCLVDLAHAVSCDFVKRPQLYTAVAGDGDGRALSVELARLRARYGTDERIPSKVQRDAIYNPLFGDDFRRLSASLIDASAAFATRVFNEGVEMLRERVRTTHRPFKEYMLGLRGDSLTWSRGEALPQVTEVLAYRALRARGVAAVFGVSTPPNEAWPYAEDANGDKTVEQVSTYFAADPEYEMSRLTREGISNRQRIALRGAEALATVLDYGEGGAEEDLNLLISKCYTWGAALLTRAGATGPTATTTRARAENEGSLMPVYDPMSMAVVD